MYQHTLCILHTQSSTCSQQQMLHLRNQRVFIILALSATCILTTHGRRCSVTRVPAASQREPLPPPVQLLLLLQRPVSLKRYPFEQPQ